ncbi:MAG: hypothetical protein AAB432_02235 [Patescibacteria group bacterium]
MTSERMNIWICTNSIHVATRKGKKKFETAELEGKKRDVRVLDPSVEHRFVYGLGSREKPYSLPASDHSAFVGFIILWLKLRKEVGKFIEINDWFMKITPTGLRADDGILTNFKQFLK